MMLSRLKRNQASDAGARRVGGGGGSGGERPSGPSGAPPINCTHWGTVRGLHPISTPSRPVRARLKPPITRSPAARRRDRNHPRRDRDRRSLMYPSVQPSVPCRKSDRHINSRQFRMACEDGQESHRVAARPEDLDQRIDKLRGTFGEIGDTRLTVNGGADHFRRGWPDVAGRLRRTRGGDGRCCRTPVRRGRAIDATQAAVAAAAQFRRRTHRAG